MQSDLIKVYQRKLNDLGGKLVVDGIFGPRTADTATALGFNADQHRSELEAGKLPDLANTAGSYAGRARRLSDEGRKEVIKAYQTWLNAQVGSTLLVVDGILGPRTRELADRLGRSVPDDLGRLTAGQALAGRIRPQQRPESERAATVLEELRARRYDPLTIRAYQSFLNRNGATLIVDGLLGPKTVEAALLQNRDPEADIERALRRAGRRTSELVVSPTIRVREDARNAELGADKPASAPKRVAALATRNDATPSIGATVLPRFPDLHPLDPRYLATAQDPHLRPFTRANLELRTPLDHPARRRRGPILDNVRIIDEVLRAAGYSPQARDALLKVIGHETGGSYDPLQLEVAPSFAAANGQNRGGFGLLQWTHPGRVKGLQRFVVQRGTRHVGDVRDQVEWMLNEPEMNAFRPGDINDQAVSTIIERFVFTNTQPGDKRAAARKTLSVQVPLT